MYAVLTLQEGADRAVLALFRAGVRTVLYDTCGIPCQGREHLMSCIGDRGVGRSMPGVGAEVMRCSSSGLVCVVYVRCTVSRRRICRTSGPFNAPVPLWLSCWSLGLLNHPGAAFRDLLELPSICGVIVGGWRCFVSRRLVRAV